MAAPFEKARSKAGSGVPALLTHGRTLGKLKLVVESYVHQQGEGRQMDRVVKRVQKK
jgi:hypothetical protein